MYSYHVVNTVGHPPESRKVYAYFNASTMHWAYTPARVLAKTFLSLADATSAIDDIEAELGGGWKPSQCGTVEREAIP